MPVKCETAVLSPAVSSPAVSSPAKLSPAKIGPAKTNAFVERIPVRISGTTVPDRSCELVGIDAGSLYLRSETQIPESSSITVSFDHVRLSGIVAGCLAAPNRSGRDEWMITVALVSCKRRLEDRFPYGEEGAIGIVESEGTTLRKCTIIDTSTFGLGLRLKSPIDMGARVYVEAGSMIIFGEIRHCRPTLEGSYVAGMLIVDVVPDTRTQNLFSVMLNILRWKLASSIRGRDIPAYPVDH